MIIDKEKIAQLLYEAKLGSEIATEKLINYYRTFILNIAGHLTKRYITWSDDEASICLLAFNRAINTFEEDGGRSFLNYAYLLIKRDLIDYYRKEKRHENISLFDYRENSEEHSFLEINQTMESYTEDLKSTELIEEIIELDKFLESFNISYEELENYSPKHKDTQEKLYEMASNFVADSELVNLLLQKKRLPIAHFTEKFCYKYKTVERYRKYLIVLIILKLNPQWVNLSQYIKD